MQQRIGGIPKLASTDHKPRLRWDSPIQTYPPFEASPWSISPRDGRWVAKHFAELTDWKNTSNSLLVQFEMHQISSLHQDIQFCADASLWFPDSLDREGKMQALLSGVCCNCDDIWPGAICTPTLEVIISRLFPKWRTQQPWNKDTTDHVAGWKTAVRHSMKLTSPLHYVHSIWHGWNSKLLLGKSSSSSSTMMYIDWSMAISGT